MQVIPKCHICEATQWLKPGDHPHVEITVGTINGMSGPHYTINTQYGRIHVQEGCWIIENKSTGSISVFDKENFKKAFQNVS